MKDQIFGVHVLFNDTDAEPLDVENVVDWEDTNTCLWFVDASGNRWYVPHTSMRWAEITPMGES
jgi:hypothetical protein